MPPSKGQSYYDVLTQAVSDIVEHGYDSAERVSYWMGRLKEAASRSAQSDVQLQQMMRDALTAIYRRMIERGQIAQYHQGVARFTIERLRPQLRTELDRRILASANLIKLDKTSAVEKTLQRFAGWATSVPRGGTRAADRPEVKADVYKSLAKLKFERQRVIIDQSQKLVANINNIVATDGGAIALRWHSRFRQPNYNYREEHKERDYDWNKSQGREWMYLLRNCWAHAQGLVKTGDAGYYDQVDAVAVDPFCKCSAVYIYALRDLPASMLTARGQTALAEARAKIKTLGRMIPA